MDALRHNMRKHLDVCGASQHLLGSIVITIDGDNAISRSYVQARHVGVGDRAHAIFDSGTANTPTAGRASRKAGVLCGATRSGFRFCDRAIVVLAWVLRHEERSGLSEALWSTRTDPGRIRRHRREFRGNPRGERSWDPLSRRAADRWTKPLQLRRAQGGCANPRSI